MSKPKTIKKKATAKTRRPIAKAAVVNAPAEPRPKARREDLCVFAFRLTPEKRADIHRVAGPGKASKFVRALGVAAARGDEATVKAITKAVHGET